MQRKVLIGVTAVVLGGTAFYLFRPDTLFINKSVSEALPAAAAATGPVTLARGEFKPGSHHTEGMAAVLRLEDGRRLLRLTGFETSNGPQLHVYLVAAADVPDNATVKKAGFVDLGALKGNKGDQNYDIPDGVDLEKYRSATIWCARFGVNFGSAPLMAEMRSAGSEPILAGEFKGHAHGTQGTASIYEVGGERIVRLTNFKTSNGPQLHVYLVAAPDATDNATVKKAGFVDLGALKGNKGDQNYRIPAGTDLEKHRAVTIWCVRFSVNFGTAPLTPAS